MLEKGRLYSLRKDGTKDSLYLNIKDKRFLFGSSEYCTVRIYIDGIFPEHCVLTVGGQGKVYLEPLHPSALTLVNGIKIKQKICLQNNDVVKILAKDFQFAYPPNSLSRIVSFKRRILPYSKQINPSQKFEILASGKKCETSQPFGESNLLNIDYIPKKQLCKIESDIFKKIPEYLLKFTHKEPVNILYEKMNVQGVNSSCSDKFLIKYRNKYVNESLEERRNLALKLYEFISFLRGLLNRNEYLYVLWPILESVWNYCTVKASEDILFLPLKSLDLKGEITIHKKSLQSRILSCTSKNLSPVSNLMSGEENHCVSSLEVDVSSNGKMDGQKQNQYSSRKISISYKKRVSLAVKRYHLRKRKSIMMAKASEIGGVETVESLGERPQMKEMCREINSSEQDVVQNLERRQTTRTKRKRGYNKKEKEELPDKRDLKIKQEISIEVVKDAIGKLNTTSEQVKEKRRKKAAAKKIDLNRGKENIAELTDHSSGNQVTMFSLKDKKQSKEKQNSRNKGLKLESEKECIEDSAGKHATNTKFTETKATKRSYKGKKKDAVTNKTALKDEMETKLIHDSPMKQSIISETNDTKSKKRNYEKKKEVSREKTGSCKSTLECDIELSRCQRITRSMARSRQ